MWKCRAALAALLLWAGAVHAQVEVSKGCLRYPRLDLPPVRKLPAVAKFFADFEPGPEPNQPSKVEVIYSNVPEQLQSHFVEYLESVRWTCDDMPASARRKVEWFWVGFRDGSRRTGFTEPKLSLSQFLTRMKEVPGERVSFNLDEMGCPFVVEWRSFRPAAPNRAVVTAQPDPRQEPFLRWLASLEVDVPDATQVQLIGESMEVGVPCGSINLGPPAAGASAPG